MNKILVLIAGAFVFLILHVVDNNAYAAMSCYGGTSSAEETCAARSASFGISLSVANQTATSSGFSFACVNSAGGSYASGSCYGTCDDGSVPDASTNWQCPPPGSQCADGESLMGTVCCPLGTTPSSLGDGNGTHGSTNSCSCPDLAQSAQTGVCADDSLTPDLPTDCETELELAVIACGADQIQTFDCESTLENGGDSNVSVAYVCGDPPDNADGCPTGTTYGSFNENYACYPNGDDSGGEPDMDGDGIPDSTDDDIDGDGIPNGSDDTPSGAGSGTDDGGTDDGGGTTDGSGDSVDLSGVEGQLSSINGTLSGMSGTLGGIKSDTAGIRSNTANTANAVNALGSKIDATTTAITDLATAQSGDSIKLDEISQGIAASGVFADLTAQGVGNINDTLTAQSGQLGDINAGLTALGDSTTEGNGRLADLNDGLSTLNDAILESDDDTQIAIENFSDDVAAADAATNESLDAIEDKADESNGLLGDILNRLGDVFDSSEVQNQKQQETTDALTSIETTLDENGTATTDGLTGIETAVDETTTAVNGVATKLDSIGTTASDILEKMPSGIGSSEEDPEEAVTAAKARLNAAYERMVAAPILAAGGDVFGALPSGDGACPAFSMQLFGEQIGTSLHCDIFDSVSSGLSAVFLAFWSIVAVMVFRRV